MSMDTISDNTSGCVITNAVIESVSIDDAERGLLTAWLTLDYGGTGQGFGGYTLYLPSNFAHHKLMSPAGHFIWRCMQIGGVSKWADLKGKTIRVRQEHKFGRVQAIGHIIKDDWFCPDADFAALAEVPEGWEDER